MFIFHMLGGLGNQLFIYAAGRALSLRSRVAVRFDTAWYSGQTERALEIKALVPDFPVAGLLDVSTMAAYGNIVRLQHPFDFNAAIMEVQAPAYFRGYFQSYRYFEDHSHQIRTELEGRIAARGKEFVDATGVEAVESVAVHVRRGDFVGNGLALVSPEGESRYYADAIDLVNERIGRPRFFVFSDDIEWVKERMRFPKSFVYVDDRRIGAALSLFVMSRCRHHVVANSTFSWWAAWLADSVPENHLVVCPKMWAKHPVSLVNLIPPTWRVLD